MKKVTLFSLLFTGLFAVAILGLKVNSNLSSLYADECNHEGNHYAMVLPTSEKDGHKEFWACCKCHKVYLEKPIEGTFIDNDDSHMTGGLSDPHPAFINHLTEVVVTFIDHDNTTTHKVIDKGSTIVDVPTPKSKVGYVVTWDRTDFTNINTNITVTAITTAKEFTVYLDANGGHITQTSITVTYDATYSLETPTHDEFGFKVWKYGEVEVSLTGTWNIDSESDTIELVAEWGESEWTPIY